MASEKPFSYSLHRTRCSQWPSQQNAWVVSVSATMPINNVTKYFACVCVRIKNKQVVHNLSQRFRQPRPACIALLNGLTYWSELSSGWEQTFIFVVRLDTLNDKKCESKLCGCAFVVANFPTCTTVSLCHKWQTFPLLWTNSVSITSLGDFVVRR